MKVMSLLMVMAFMTLSAGVASAETNALALGVEKLTKAPFSMLKGGNDHLFTPVKEINHGVLTVGDEVRAAVVSAGLNFGQAVEG